MIEANNELRAAVSGSFHRHMDAITRAVHELVALSVRVLSPADPRVVAAQGEFLFVASDRVRSIRLVQDRHMDCIRAADFLWLVCPDGYVGVSAAMEIEAAHGASVPVFATRAPIDLTLREYITVVPRLSEAIRQVEANRRLKRPQAFLIDPHASMQEAHDILEQVEIALTLKSGQRDLATRAYHDLARVRTMLVSPAVIQ